MSSWKMLGMLAPTSCLKHSPWHTEVNQRNGPRIEILYFIEGMVHPLSEINQVVIGVDMGVF